MKLYTKIFFVILFVSGLNAQVIVSTPAFPTENDSITITFNAAEATNTSLVGYTGDLYTHTGVNTSTGGIWQHVIGNWGDNSVQPKLTRIGTDLYELVIGYPREFYNITDPNEHITSLNFVFRSADASKQTEDLFLPISEGGLEVSIQQPSKPLNFVAVNEELNIEVISSNADTLYLFLNDSLLVQTTADSLSYNLISTEAMTKYIIAKAVDTESNMVVDSVGYVVYGDVQEEGLPEGVEAGINYTSDNNVTLVLFAPLKEFVYVIGDFNNWMPQPSSYMKRTPNDSTYWIEITGLTPGEEYGFQYIVDGEITVADPYSEKILDPWNDDEITDETYPDLKAYPYGKTTEAVGVLQTAQQPYNWQVTNFERPEKKNLVIYELLIRDFLQSHNYQTLIDTLDYLENLGVNAIELMPVTEFEGNKSWGYNPSFHFALDKYYGTKNKFKEFIDECHMRGIAVIMDVVLNHAFGQSPFVRLYNDGGYSAPTLDNPWLNRVARHPYNVGYDFNHESPHTQYFVDKFNKYWLQEFNIDGFRYDLSKGFTQFNSGDNVGLWGQYDQSRINILKRMADEIHTYDSTAYLILEHFADNSEEFVLSDYGFMLWGNLNYNYNEATMGYHDDNKSDFSWISYQARGWNDPHVVGYMESHDEERLMYKNLQYGNSSGSYNIQNLVTALQRMKMAASFFFTIPGPKMIWQFGELGYDFSINYPSGTDNDRLTPKPIRWDYLDNVYREKLYKTFSALIKLKQNYDVFSTDDFELNVSGSIKTIKLNHDSMDVFIIGNFGVTSNTLPLDFQHQGVWYNYFSGDSVNYSGSNPVEPLDPGEFHIYTTEKLPTPEGDIISNIDKIESEVPNKFFLAQNYPNPFNPSTTINFAVPVQSDVKIVIYNVLGEIVKTIIDKKMNAGSYSVSFNAGNTLSSGIYFYNINAAGIDGHNFIQTKKMLLIK